MTYVNSLDPYNSPTDNSAYYGYSCFSERKAEYQEVPTLVSGSRDSIWAGSPMSGSWSVHLVSLQTSSIIKCPHPCQPWVSVEVPTSPQTRARQPAPPAAQPVVTHDHQGSLGFTSSVTTSFAEVPGTGDASPYHPRPSRSTQALMGHLSFQEVHTPTHGHGAEVLSSPASRGMVTCDLAWNHEEAAAWWPAQQNQHQPPSRVVTASHQASFQGSGTNSPAPPLPLPPTPNLKASRAASRSSPFFALSNSRTQKGS